MSWVSLYNSTGNPVNHFPIYQPSEERIAEIAKAHADENNPLGVHYDAAKEVRAKGAGFYQFSADEETRAAQMEELKSSREETERTRAELGAQDVRPGEIEGMKAGSSGSAGKSRAMEKRKRELEERRKLLEAKRRKIKGDDASASGPAAESTAATSTSDAQLTETRQASASRPSPSPQIQPSARGSNTSNLPSDPFAALEAKSIPSARQAEKKKATAPQNEAEFFLAQLESEFLGSRNKKPA